MPAAFLPPAWAMLGRPPPRPSTRPAICLITLPAWNPASRRHRAGSEQGRSAFSVTLATTQATGPGDLLVHGIPYVAQVGSFKALELGNDELVAAELDSTLDGAGNGVGGTTGQSLFELGWTSRAARPAGSPHGREPRRRGT